MSEPERRHERLAETIERYLARGARADLSRLLGRLRPGDAAVLLADLESTRQLELFEILAADLPDAAGGLLSEMAPAQRLDLLERLPPERTADLLQRIPIDDAVFVLESLPEELHDRVLDLANLGGLAAVETHLGFREGSAGRIMDTELFALPESESVQTAISAIQEKRDLEMIFYLYVVDRDKHLVGVTSLRQLLFSKPAQTLSSIMQRSVIKANVDTDQEEVAALAARYDLLAVPVVDDQNRLVGIVTVDDIIDVVQEEATEDLFKMAGTTEGEILYEERTLRVVGLRLPSLLLSAVGLLATGLLLQLYQVRMSDALYLLAFVPLIMGLGGSVGHQSTTLVVRGLASGELATGGGRLFEFLVRQAKVALLLGLGCGVLVGCAALLLERSWRLGLAVGLALLVSIFLAAIAGALLPLGLRRVGLDPAVASGPVLAAVHDVTGIFVYFSLAAALLRHVPH